MGRIPLQFLFVLGALAASGCGTSDPAALLGPSSPTSTSVRWGGTWYADLGTARVAVTLSSQRHEGEWFSVWYSVSGGGTISYAEAARESLPLLLDGTSGAVSGLVLNLRDGRLPGAPTPGTTVAPALVATFRATQVSDTTLVGMLTLAPTDSLSGPPPLEVSGAVTFRRR